MLLSLTDVSSRPAKGADLAGAWLKQDGEKITKKFLDPARAQLDRAVRLGGKVFDKGREMYRDPTLAQALMLADDPPTALKAPLGVSKRCAWADPMGLDEVKAVGKALGCTVNDVLLASATGALSSYLLDLGEDVDGLTIRATVPVNLRPLEHAKKLGNHFGLVFLDLPIGEPNSLISLLDASSGAERFIPPVATRQMRRRASPSHRAA